MFFTRWNTRTLAGFMSSTKHGCSLNGQHKHGSTTPCQCVHAPTAFTISTTTTTTATATNATSYHHSHLQFSTCAKLPTVFTHTTASTHAGHASPTPCHLLLPTDNLPQSTAPTTTGLPYRVPWLRHCKYAATSIDANYSNDATPTNVNNHINEHCAAQHDHGKRTSGHVTTTTTATTWGHEPQLDIGL